VTHLDTSFLVDLIRDFARGKRGRAARFLEGMDDEVRLSVHAVCELLAGVESSRSRAEEAKRVGHLLAGLPVDYPAEGFAETYASLFGQLTAKGARIPTMDLLIATAAVLADARIVTRDEKDFSRVPGLTVVSY
jgi:tRNA(fMet)-specific endonuclease VapC